MNNKLAAAARRYMAEPRLYVLVRRDLSMSQQVVQSGHAVAEWALRGPKTKWKNGTLIVLGVSGKRQLEAWMRRLERLGVTFRTFREPDIGNQPTALAAVHTGSVFRSLTLL